MKFKSVIVASSVALIVGCKGVNLSFLSPTAQQQQEQSSGCSTCDSGCSTCGSGGSGGSGSAVSFNCILSESGSSCTVSIPDGLSYEMETVCAATSLTPAVSRVDTVSDGFRIDPIQSGQGPHSCQFSLLQGSTVISGPITKFFTN